MGTSFAEMSSWKASWDKDNILYQIYKSKYVQFFIMVIWIFKNIIRKQFD